MCSPTSSNAPLRLQLPVHQHDLVLLPHARHVQQLLQPLHIPTLQCKIRYMHSIFLQSWGLELINNQRRILFNFQYSSVWENNTDGWTPSPWPHDHTQFRWGEFEFSSASPTGIVAKLLCAGKLSHANNIDQKFP